MHQQTLDPPLKLWEWFWTIYARACFWNKHYHWPYGGLSERKTRILMTLRGESLDAEHTHDGLPVYSCDHDECGRPGPAREDYDSLADWEEAVLFHGYTSPTHWDETDHPALLQEELGDRYAEEQDKLEKERRYWEIVDEMENDRKIDAAFTRQWQEATALPEPRTPEQERAIANAEQ